MDLSTCGVFFFMKKARVAVALGGGSAPDEQSEFPRPADVLIPLPPLPPQAASRRAALPNC